jgi:putative spermidine/putrescine transport system ATP-binding protein
MAGTREDSFVRFENVQKTYDGATLVVKSLDLTIGHGEFLTLLGPSGSGKTTTLMMLAGFETATSGDIFLDTERLNDIPPHKRGIGMVFQNYALFPHMNVFDNVAFPLKVRKAGASETRERVKRALDMVRMSGFETRRPAQLSGGQQQRIALARALVFEPKLLLMDEPLGALDKQLREHMQYEIKHLHERLGVTIVYVTHDQSEALTMSDRIAVFNDGRIQQLAKPADLYERPENSFVAQFIGENNRLRGVTRAVRDGRALVELAGGVMIEAIAARTAVGQPTQVSIRPERVTIDAPASEVGIEARVEEAIYHGDHIRLRMRVLDNDDFVVKLGAAGGARAFAGGETVRLGWAVNDGRALDV